MRSADLQALFAYSYWANGRLFAGLRRLSAEEFIRPVAGGHSSIRNTLVHVLSAEWGWLERCGGPARGERLRPEDYPTLEAVERSWAQVELWMRDFLAGLGEADLSREISFAFGGPEQQASVGDLLEHAAVHAIHHRGQVATLLRLLGHAPEGFDFLVYVTSDPAETGRELTAA